jgi:hypothetical protein
MDPLVDLMSMSVPPVHASMEDPVRMVLMHSSAAALQVSKVKDVRIRSTCARPIPANMVESAFLTSTLTLANVHLDSLVKIVKRTLMIAKTDPARMEAPALT